MIAASQKFEASRQNDKPHHKADSTIQRKFAMVKSNRLMLLLAAVGLVIGALFTSSASADTRTGQPDSPTVMAGFQIASNMNNRCLTVAHFNTGNGASIHMYDCNGASSQRWTWNGPELRSDVNGKCLELPFGNGDNGGVVEMYDCSGWNQQWWHWNGSELHSNLNHRCLTIANSNWWVGAAVLIHDCVVGATNQQWRVA